MINKLAINTVGEELEASSEYCREHGIGIEISDFAFPKNLDIDMTARIQRHKNAVAGISPIISHGPFLDLIATSMDSAIVEVTRKRHTDSLRAAREIGATRYIVHTNFNPMIRNASYVNNFTKRMREFWLPFADEAAKNQIVICFENLWEAGPEIQTDFISTAGHPNLKASFDNGHALVFSRKPAKYWIEALGENLAHCHLHDNYGENDEHKSVGEGKENWVELLEAAKTFSPQAVLVMESDYLESNKISMEKIKNLLTNAYS